MVPDSGLLDRKTTLAFDTVLAMAQAAIVTADASVFMSFDHSAAAAKVGLSLRRTTILLFGNPVGGTRLMQVRPDSALDLPMKLLLVENDDGTVRIVGEDPAWIARRHGGFEGLDAIVAGMRALMNTVLDATAQPGSAAKGK